MEQDQEELDIRHAQKVAKSTSLPIDGTSTSSTSSPTGAEFDKKAVGHDSLVTVRLSEPPSLHVNTAIPPSPLPNRTSLYGLEDTPDDTPTDAMAEIDKEEQPKQVEDLESMSPIAADTSLNLQEELEQMEPDAQDDDGENSRLSPPFSHSRSSSVVSEVVDWDQLQKSEDKESKEQENDNSTAMLLAKLEQENDKIATNPKSVKVAVVEKQELPGRQPRPPSMAQLRQMVNGPTPPALRYSVVPPPPMTELEFYMALVKDPQQTAARLPTLLSNKIRRGIPPPLRGVVWQSMSGARDTALEEVFERLSGESSPYEGIIGKDLGRSFPGVEMFRDPDGDGQRMLGRVLKCFSLYDTKIGYCQGLAFLVGPLLMHMPDKQAFCVLVRLMENYDLRHCFVPDLSGLHVRIYQFQELLRQHFPTLSAHLDDLQVEPGYVSQWFLSFFAVTCPLPMLFRIYDVIFAEGASETIMRVALSLMRKNETRILACTEMEDVMQLLLSRGLWDCYHYNADEFVQDFVNLSDIVTRERMATLEQGYREAKISPLASPSAASANQSKSGNSNTDAATAAAQTSSDVTTAASRFLGRLWASSSTPKLATFPAAVAATGSASASASSASASTSSSTNSSSTLSPRLGAASRPLSMLRRSTSKQSIASTLNSMEAAPSFASSSSASVLSSASTEATSISRDSSADGSLRESNPGKARAAIFSGSSLSSAVKDDKKNLHSQIEDLLTALSELQRNHALLASQLQKEREDREEDRRAVRSLLDGLRKKASTETVVTAHSTGSEETITGAGEDEPGTTTGADDDDVTKGKPTAEQLSDLLDVVELRFSEEATSRRSSVPQTRSQLRDELARAKEQLSHEQARTQESNRRIHEVEQEVASIKEQLRESHAHVRNLHQEKQRLERQIHGMRARASADAPHGQLSTSGGEAGDWFSRATGIGHGAGPQPASGTGVVGGGLRELKLGRSKSTPSQVPGSQGNPFGKRSSSIMMHKNPSKESVLTSHSQAMAGSSSSGPLTQPTSEHDALLLELVQAKTAEAVAKQEAEEAKQKLENLRKAFGLAPGETPGLYHNGTPAAVGGGGVSGAASAAMGMFGRLTGAEGNHTKAASVSGASTTATPSGAGNSTNSTASGGGFWGWRR